MKKRCVVMVAAGIFCFSCLPVCAKTYQNVQQQNEMGLKFQNIQANSTRLSISGKTATAKADIVVRSKTNISIAMKLQKKRDNSWITVKTWSNTYTNQLSASSVRTTSVSEGSTYRVVTSFVAGDEVTTSYSNSVTA